MRRVHNWRRWGPYLAERQWGTVREDYSATGECWTYFPHDHARSRVYRWGEDGLLGICDRECRVCFAVALWNGRDPILKERLFGVTGPEGNHGEDVQGAVLLPRRDADGVVPEGALQVPARGLSRTPQLVDGNRARGRGDRELEIEDTGVFERGYWDVVAEYAKADPDDILIRITVTNRGDAARLHVLPTAVAAQHVELGAPRRGLRPARADRARRRRQRADRAAHARPAPARLRRPPDAAVHRQRDQQRAAVGRRRRRRATPRTRFTAAWSTATLGAVNPAFEGTKCAAWYVLDVPAGASQQPAAAADRRPAGPPRRRSTTSTRSSPRRMAEADHYHRTRARRADDRRGAPRRPPGRRRAWCGRASSITTSSSTGWTATRASRRRRPSARVGRNRGLASSCGRATSSRCPTPGSTRGSRRGTSRSTAWRWRGSTRSSPSTSCCCYAASGTCTRTASCRPTSSRSATSTRRSTRGRCGGSTSSPARPATATTASSSSARSTSA